MRRRKSLRIGVHHANGVVWRPVYRTRLRRMEENDARAGREEVLGEMMPFRRAMRSMRYVRV